MGTPIDTPIGSLLQTVFTSILEVFLLCLAGYILASKGILDKKTQKQLNRLNVSLFTPSLLFSKVAFFLSPAKLRELWIIPIFFVLVTVVSMLVSFLLGTLFRLKRSQRSFAMAAAMFMNSNSLPIALMQSLVVTVHGLKWGKDDNKNAMLGRALTYLVFYSTLGMVLRWSYGVRLLAQADDPEDAPIRLPGEEGAPLIYTEHEQEHENENDQAEPPSASSLETPDIIIDDSYTHETTLGVHKRRTKFYRSFPNSPNQSRVTLSVLGSEVGTSPGTSDGEEEETDSEETVTVDRDQDQEHLPIHHPLPTPTSSTIPPTQTRIRHAKRRLHRAWRGFTEFMTVPLWAALASLIVACIRPLQHALDEHMQPIKGALTSAGNCSIPVTLIVLGAYFYPGVASEGQAQAQGKRKRVRGASGEGEEEGVGGGVKTSSGPGSALMGSVKDLFRKRNSNSNLAREEAEEDFSRRGETKTVVIAVASRMIITPFLLIPLMALSTKFDLQRVFDDPVFVVSNVLLISSPPALTLAQITQAASGDAFERLISRTIFWAYCIVTPPATILYVVLGLLLAKL